MSRLRRLVISDRWFFITCRVLPWRGILTGSGIRLLGRGYPRTPQETRIPPERLGAPAQPLAFDFLPSLSAHDLQGDGSD